MATMEEIEQHTKEFADRRASLSEAVARLKAAKERLERRALPVIKRRVAVVTEAHAVLQAAIAESQKLFVRPKSVVMHGVRVGFAKGKGKIEFEDADQVVKLIRKHCPDMADVLIITTEEPSKKALQQLDVATLKKLGCSVEETGDQVVIKPTDGDVEKVVKAMLKGGAEDQS